MKDKAYILDFNLLAEQDISIHDFVILLHIQNDLLDNYSLEDFVSLENKQFIKINKSNNNEIIIREKGKLLLDFIAIDSVNKIGSKKIVKKSNRVILDGLDEFLLEYRNLWKGLKVGAMGSNETCKEKIIKWMTNNPSYSKEDILKASKIYLNSLNDYKYLKQADNFIYKREGNIDTSGLSSFIDEIDSKIVDDGWTSKLQ